MLDPRHYVCAGMREFFSHERRVTTHDDQPAANLKATPLMQ